jgi:hypothetical protein
VDDALRRTSLALALAALSLSGGAPSGAADKPEALRMKAFAVNVNNGARTAMLDIVIERWSTPEEIAQLQAVLVEKGDDKLLDAMQKIKPRCGYVRGANTLGWDIHVARETPLPDGGRKIVLATNRPVGVWEARNAGRSMDYQFSLAEIRLGADGKGKGKAIPRAGLVFDKEKNTLEIENWEREPVRLNEVTVEVKKEKDKK